MEELLSLRERTILSAIVQDYINRKTPIGSRTLAKDFQLGVSPATIRNTMMDLEEKGFITQPHTSAGRVPTDMGYRHYVTNIMTPEPLTPYEKETIKTQISRLELSTDAILEQATQVLSMISNQLGIIIAPSFNQGVFNHLDLVNLGGPRIMMILTIQSGLIKTILLQIDFDLTDDELFDTKQILNERLYGLTIEEIRRTVGERMADVSQGHPRLVKIMVNQADSLFNFDDENLNLRYMGTTNLLEQPEFFDVQRLKSVMEILDERRKLIKILKNLENNDDVTIIIGKENTEAGLEFCSVMATQYSIGNIKGIVSIVGPTRMSYSRLISLVRYISSLLDDVLTNRTT